MKNNALKSRKMAFVFVMIGALLIFPSIGERAAAEESSGTVVEVLDENGQIMEMSGRSGTPPESGSPGP